MRPFFSIVIPSYNAEKTVINCLNSIAIQTFTSLEIVFVDGGSRDATIDHVRTFQKGSNIDMQIVSEKDNGIYDAVNKGIRIAKGKWIYVLGTDDSLFDSDVLETVSQKMNESDRVVYGNVKVRGDAGWAKDGQIHDGEFSLGKLLQRNICQQSVFYNAAIFAEIGYFNENYKVCADWDFILRCASKYELKYIDTIVAWFYGGGTSGGGEADNFYSELPGNLYSYFGRRILKKEFQPAAWRFKKAAETERQKGHWWRAMIFNRAGKRA